MLIVWVGENYGSRKGYATTKKVIARKIEIRMRKLISFYRHIVAERPKEVVLF